MGAHNRSCERRVAFFTGDIRSAHFSGHFIGDFRNIDVITG